MANTYTKAAFTILMSHADAMLLRVAEQACEILDTGGEDEDLARQYDALDPAFRAVFPPEGASKFGTFLAIFPDPDFPCLDCVIDIRSNDANDAQVTFSGEQFGVEQVANLLLAACKSALPCGFAWVSDCDRLRPGEFAGGCVVVTGDGVRFHSTQTILERALHRIEAGADSGVDGVVLAVRDPSSGDIGFWNDATQSLGLLCHASVYHPSRAASWENVPFEEFDWMALPQNLAA